jgi:hypothetical protein
MFVPSFLAALAVYGSLYVVAPNISLIQANSSAEELLDLFHVDLWETPEPLSRRERGGDSPDTESPRPGRIEDLLERNAEPLDDPEPVLEAPTPIPLLAERVASDTIQRLHDLAQDDFAFERADAKIIEITQAASRGGIRVAKRVVAPSPDNVLDDGATPVLSGQDRLPSLAGRLGFAPGTTDPATAFVRASEPQETPKTQGPRNPEEPLESQETLKRIRPDFEEGVLREEEPTLDLPKLPIETLLARTPVTEEVIQESPYEFIDDLVSIELDSYIAPGEAQGFFRLRIVPREDRPIETLSKDITFVIDASKSIMQRKLDLTARGLRRCIAMLKPEDRFNIVVFRDSPSFFRASPTHASHETVMAANTFLDRIESRGETDLYEGIRPVIAQNPPRGNPGVVLVISDGRPTTGVLKGRDVINAVTDENLGRTTIYAFGGGRTVNRYLLDLLAYRNKGKSRVAPRMDTIDKELPVFFSELNDPILVGLKSDYGRINDTEVYPKELPDFYLGRHVEIFGRYFPSEDKEFVMRLAGDAGERQKELVFKADFEQARSGDAAIAHDWAFQKIYYLIGEICRLGERADLLSELQTLSRLYQIRTSYSE